MDCELLGGTSTDFNVMTRRGTLQAQVHVLHTPCAIAPQDRGLLLVVLGRGASEISSTFGLNQSFSDILTGIILFFILGSEFFTHYRLIFRRGKEAE